jgi:hypothetical protein
MSLVPPLDRPAAAQRPEALIRVLGGVTMTVLAVLTEGALGQVFAHALEFGAGGSPKRSTLTSSSRRWINRSRVLRQKSPLSRSDVC